LAVDLVKDGALRRRVAAAKGGPRMMDKRSDHEV